MTVVLIVEDNLLILELTEMQVQELGYDTLSASDVYEASTLLRSAQPIDLLFTDINLKSSVLGGCELAHLATRLRPKLHVLYVTGNTVTSAMRSMLIEGAPLLIKPYTQGQLTAALEGLQAA
jgi:CheY-like chemotaxis protein